MGKPGKNPCRPLSIGTPDVRTFFDRWLFRFIHSCSQKPWAALWISLVYIVVTLGKPGMQRYAQRLIRRFSGPLPKSYPRACGEERQVYAQSACMILWKSLGWIAERQYWRGIGRSACFFARLAEFRKPGDNVSPAGEGGAGCARRRSCRRPGRAR